MGRKQKETGRHQFASWALVVSVIGTVTLSLAQRDDRTRSMLPLSLCDEGKGPKSWWRTSVRWKDAEYRIEEGVDVLMSVVRNPEASSGHWNAATAITELAGLGGYIRGCACLDELKERYDACEEVERGAILLCFQASGDPRGIPLFTHILDKEKNVKLRLWAASALASWNIRRGVAELVDLLDSEKEMPRPSQLFYVRDNAMQAFRLKNLRKGWGFPDDKESAEWPPDVAPPPSWPPGVASPELLARWKSPPTVEEIKKWWSENQHRFPDWKPGDPLPGVEENQGVPDHSDEK